MSARAIAVAALALATYQTNCASCHGARGAGTPNGPPLIDVPVVMVRFMLDTGRMPAAVPGVEAPHRAARLSPAQIAAVTAYVAGLSAKPDTALPDVRPGDARRGRDLFAENCQACHGATGNGGAVGGGTYVVAPSLAESTGPEIGEAIRAGPGAMPRFGPTVLDARDVDDIAAFVGGAQRHPKHPGGLTLSGVGPVAEGLVAWLAGIGVLLILVRLLGSANDRT